MVMLKIELTSQATNQFIVSITWHHTTFRREIQIYTR